MTTEVHATDPQIAEAMRLRALLACGVLDTEAERRYDDLVTLAATICEVPIAAISLIDTDRQWFKASRGLEVAETPREIAFCDMAIRTPEQTLVVEDAAQDARFAANPLVTGALGIRFYTGIPLVSREHHALGTLCVIDREPRVLSDRQTDALRTLARQVQDQLEMNRVQEELSIANRQLREFVQLTAHDMQTPLRHMASFASLLRDEYLDKAGIQGRTYIEHIVSGAKQLRHLTTRMLAYVQTGKGHASFGPVDLHTVCETVLAQLHTQMTQVHAQAEIVSQLPTVYGEPDLLQQLFEHLLGNALKYRRPNAPAHLSVGAARVGSRHVLHVNDNGIGIAADQHEQVFAAFARAHDTSHARGSGLGLAHSRRIVEFHGGHMWLESTPGQGSTFYFSLPASGPSACS